MTDSQILNALGLLCDMTGVIMLYLYGLPSKVSEGGESHLSLSQIDPKQSKMSYLVPLA